MSRPYDSADSSYDSYDSYPDRPPPPPRRRLWAGVTGLACAATVLLCELGLLFVGWFQFMSDGLSSQEQNRGAIWVGIDSVLALLFLTPVLLLLVLALVFGLLGACLGRGAGRWLGIAATALTAVEAIPIGWSVIRIMSW